jgi:hypothetical protein
METTVPEMSKTYYWGGKEFDKTKGAFLSTDPEYSAKFASQTGGTVHEITLNAEPKIYPKTFGWQEYQNIWQPNQMFKGYDAVRVIEPNDQGESLVIINPAIFSEKPATPIKTDIPETQSKVETETTEKPKWINAHGKKGVWATQIEGQNLRIDYVPAARFGKHYVIGTRYNNEMFAHQYYTTLKEAQDEAVRMLKAHLEVRKSQGLKLPASKPSVPPPSADIPKPEKPESDLSTPTIQTVFPKIDWDVNTKNSS